MTAEEQLSVYGIGAKLVQNMIRPQDSQDYSTRRAAMGNTLLAWDAKGWREYEAESGASFSMKKEEVEQRLATPVQFTPAEDEPAIDNTADELNMQSHSEHAAGGTKCPKSASGVAWGR